VTLSLVEAFHAEFYSFPPPSTSVGVTIVWFYILSTALDGSIFLDGRTGMVCAPFALCALGVLMVFTIWWHTMLHLIPSERIQEYFSGFHQKGKAVSPRSWSYPASWHIHTRVYFVHVYEYVNAKFSPSGFFRPSGCLIPTPGLATEHPICAVCVCVCIYMHIHPHTLRPASK